PHGNPHRHAARGRLGRRSRRRRRARAPGAGIRRRHPPRRRRQGRHLRQRPGRARADRRRRRRRAPAGVGGGRLPTAHPPQRVDASRRRRGTQPRHLDRRPAARRERARDTRAGPEVRRFGFGARLSVPPLAEAWAWWRAVTTAADPYLDTLTGKDLTRKWKREPSGETPGTKLHRTTYHYWFHLGE